MKKKLFFKFMVFAVIGSLVTMTSCKDYDDDISGLQNQIDQLATKSEMTAELSTLQSTIATAQSGATAAATKADEALTAANQALADAKEAKEAADAAGNAEEVEALATQVTELEGEIAGLLEEIDAINEQLEEIAGLEDRVNQLISDLQETSDAQFDAFKEEMNTLFASLKSDVDAAIAELGNEIVPITKLTLIPDYVADQGGALPVINFSPLAAECGEIAPTTQVRYQVSPSNASAAMIDVESIYFKYNNPQILTRSADIDAKATFVSLENGVLTVEVDVNTLYIEGENSEGIDQLMLMVPLVSGGEVSSDWATVVSSQTSWKDLALVRVPKVNAESAWSTMALTTTLDETKALPVTSPVVVDIEYDETLDLLDVVNTMLTSGAWSNFNIDTYNLEYAFDLKDEEGNTIVYELGANETDQQKFINLVGSEVSTRVYDLDGPNPAAVDRTPIVHVMLKSKDGSIDCNVLEGFIKLNIVEKKVVPVPPVEIPATGDVEAGCDDYTLRIGTQRMNEEFYAKAEVSKTFFHTNYEWASSDTDGVGTIVEVEDPNDTESFNLLWTVAAADLAANVGKTITKSGTYTYGGSVIQVTFTADVTQPSIDLSGLLLDNYWFSNNTYIKHNVATPDLGATDPALATYENNISAAFKTTAEKLLDLEFIDEDYAGYTYEYVFDADQPVKTVDGITVSVSTDGKELRATQGTTTETVATILSQAANTGDILEYNEDSDLGKYLLNKGPEHMKARIKLQITNECEQPVVVTAFGGKDSFLVHFLRPVNVEGQAADFFVDGVDFGDDGSILDLRDVVQLSDWRNYVGNVESYYFDPDNENYYDYYDVQSYTVDVTDIKAVGLTVGGTALTELPSTIEVEQVAASSEYPYGTLTYRNNGANLATEFSIIVPVTVTYKWGEVVTEVEVLVKPTSEVTAPGL